MARYGVLVLIFLSAAPLAGASTVAVTDCGDNGGPGQLRQVIAAAAPGDMISIPACTIVVTAGEIAITKSLTVHGVSAAATVIDGNASTRIFHATLPASASLLLARVTLRNGMGALFNDGFATPPSSVAVTDAVVTTNDMGAITSSSNGTLSLTNVVVSHNRSTVGGGLSLGGKGILTNVTFSDNAATLDGGGIALIPGSPPQLTVNGGTFTGNRAGRHGGGITTYPITACAISETLTNVTFTGNSAGTVDATGLGGAMTASTTVLTNVTFSGNAAPAGNGGGIGYSPNCVSAMGTILLNTIVAGSTSGGNCSHVLFSDGHNISSDATCGFNGPGDQNSTDPMLGPLANNGGSTATQALLPGSPALDTGDDVRCPVVDQRGILRPAGAACDIGAYEQGTVTDRIFAGAFDTATVSGWSAASTDGGDLATSPDAAMSVSTRGLQATVNDTNPLYVEDDTPAAERRYRARFYLDPNGFDPGEADGHLRIRTFILFSEGPARRVAAVILKRQGGVLSLMGRARLDDNTQADTLFFTLTDAPHVVEIDLKAASSPDAVDGTFQLWIDGTSRSILSGLDNSRGAVDFVRLGTIAVKSGANGVVYFDEFDSHRATYVGP